MFEAHDMAKYFKDPLGTPTVLKKKIQDCL